MDAVLSSIRTLSAGSGATTELALEDPSNAPLKRRYVEPYTLRSVRHADRTLVVQQTRDAIGTGTWTGGVVLSRLLERLAADGAEGAEGAAAFAACLSDRRRPVVELGAGTGLVGLAAKLLCGFDEVLMTDLPGAVLDNLSRNAEANCARWSEQGLPVAGGAAAAAALDWHEAASSPAAALPPCELLLGAELVYEKDSVEPLLGVVGAFFDRGARHFLLANSTCGRPGYRVFRARLRERYDVLQMDAAALKGLASPAATHQIDVLLITRRAGAAAAPAALSPSPAALSPYPAALSPSPSPLSPSPSPFPLRPPPFPFAPLSPAPSPAEPRTEIALERLGLSILLDADHVDPKARELWSHVWGSGALLGELLCTAPMAALLRGRRSVELGAGIGVASLSGARLGLDATATDVSEAAVRTALRNAERNGVARNFAARRVDWRRPPAELLSPPRPFDLVLAADVLYISSQLEHVLNALEGLMDSGAGPALIMDPGRPSSEGFEAMARARGLGARRLEAGQLSFAEGRVQKLAVLFLVWRRGDGKHAPPEAVDAAERAWEELVARRRVGGALGMADFAYVVD